MRAKCFSEKQIPTKTHAWYHSGWTLFCCWAEFRVARWWSIFGLGQFRDGQYNLKNITRRLTQVNSQIAIPFIYSSKGYGLLWHQYGLTDFNPADNFISLEQQQSTTEWSEWPKLRPRYLRKYLKTNRCTKIQCVCGRRLFKYFWIWEYGKSSFCRCWRKTCCRSDQYVASTNFREHWYTSKLVSIRCRVLCKSDNTPALSWRLNSNTTTFRSPVAKRSVM